MFTILTFFMTKHNTHTKKNDTTKENTQNNNISSLFTTSHTLPRSNRDVVALRQSIQKLIS